MKVPIDVALKCAREGGFIEADGRGGVWWHNRRARAAWGNMASMIGREL